MSDLVERDARREAEIREALECCADEWRTDGNHLVFLLRLLDAARGDRDTATRALAVLDKIAWLAAEEDSWFGNENDIAVQRAAAERHRAALSKTEGKG